jgi:hypothetical protein
MDTLLFYIIIFSLLCLVYNNFTHNTKTNETITNTDNTPPIYYINVDKSTERKQRYEERVSKFPHLSIERISAITPQSLKNYTLNIPDSCNRSDLEYSCTLSHIKAIFTAYKHLIHNPHLPSYALITEDDLVIINLPNWSQLTESAPSDWEILQLMAIGPFAENMYQQKLQGWQPHLRDVIWSTAAYLINIKGMEKILETSIPDYKNITDWNNVSTIHFVYPDSNCVADIHLYTIAKTYTSQIPFVNVEGIDSIIHPEHLSIHQSAIDVINSVTS